MAIDDYRTWVERDRVAAAVVGITVLAVMFRLVALGGRITHFDEARVAWWTLDFARTGRYHYRFIIHGPFIQFFNKYLFAVLGPSDFVIRIVPALVGGLLPLAALLFRDRLRDVEVIGLALFLAANPVLLYYSRFSRSTILVAGFMFVAFGLLVRAIDTWDVRYAHAGVAFAALGFAAKENAIVYVLCWLGASALILDHRLFSPFSGESGVARLRAFWADQGARVRDRPSAFVGHAALAVGLFAAIIVFFYAPRAGTGGGIGLWQALTAPGKVPQVVDAMITDIVEGYEYWFGRPGQTAEKKDLLTVYLDTLTQFFGVLSRYAAPLFGLAVVGFLVERYSDDYPRDLVMFASYWGFVSVLGYPLGTDIKAGWVTVNAIVPLAIPAAVGLAVLYRWGREALADNDTAGVGLTALLLVLIAGQIAVAGVGAVYLHPVGEDNGLVQYAQPQQELRPIVADMMAAADGNDGPDVVVYEQTNYSRSMVDGRQGDRRTPSCLSWHTALPLPWYMDKERMNVTCAASLAALQQQTTADPPFIVARASDRTAIAQRLDDYAVYPANNGTYHQRTLAFEKVVFVHENADLDG